MPPKNKTKEPVQTKLSFKPASANSGKSLFTFEAPAPQRSHMSILNNQSNNTIRTATSISTLATSTSSSVIPAQRRSDHDSFLSRTEQQGQTPQIGGKILKGTHGAAQNSVDVFSTQDLASSISTSIPEPKFLSVSTSVATSPTTVNGVDREYIPGCNTSESPKNQEMNIDAQQAIDSSKRQSESVADTHERGHVGHVELDSDSDDELLRMPKQTTSTSHDTSASLKSSKSLQHSTSSSSPNTPGSIPPAIPKRSLLDQMATPRGTQPLPRTTALLNSRGSSTFGRAPERPPLLVSYSSSVSDDGFFSGSSLDSKMLRTGGSQEPEMTPPLSQSSEGSQQNLSIREKVKSYSQKRSAELAGYSVGGTKKRILPPTVTGYQPVSSFKPQVQTMASLSRSSSFDKTTSPTPTASHLPHSASSQSSSQPSNGELAYQKGVTKDGVILSDEQRYVLEQVVLYHRNVFFTGSAGTGKSVLLRELIIQLRNKYNNRNKKDMWESAGEPVAVTASTGIAACNIGGCTLHTFAGVGLGQEALPVLQARVRKNPNVTRRWMETKVLIIDEISMVDSDFMDKMEALARSVRRNESPWGGIQVVMTGDFFQLPPVNRSGNVKFCFEGESWSRTIHETIQLRKVFRQKDATFANMLNEMRLGQMSPTTIGRFRTLTRDLKANDGLRPTELFPLRNQVDEANNRMLNSLPGKTVVYTARDRGPLKEKMEQNCLAPTTLQLKVNSQVMLLRNQGGGSGGLVNGSLGILIGFVNQPADNDNQIGSSGDRKGTLNTPGEELPLVRFTLDGGSTRDMVVGREEWKIELPNGDLQGARIQIPLGLAWSLSIHKSQGQTLPKVRVDLGKVFEKGQAYVALSRATTLEGLQVLNFDPRKVMVHPKVTEFYSSLRVYKSHYADSEDTADGKE